MDARKESSGFDRSVRCTKMDFIKTIFEPLFCLKNVKRKIRNITKAGFQKCSSVAHRCADICGRYPRSDTISSNEFLTPKNFTSQHLIGQKFNLLATKSTKRNLYFDCGADVRRVCGCLKKIYVLLYVAHVTKYKKCGFYCLVRV